MSIFKKTYLKEFLMTLAATTVSIILTFGTTAIIDRHKQRAEKREMVMMVLFDMRETLNELQQCDQDLNQFFETQVDVVAHPEKFDDSFFSLLMGIPMPDYTTTTENIFRSNIETLRTIGNILFVETVSSFYDMRLKYQRDVVDGFQAEAKPATENCENLRELDTPAILFTSDVYLTLMQRDFAQCKLMMKVSDKDLEVFDRQQQKLRDAASGDSATSEASEAPLRNKARRDRFQQALKAGKQE